MMSYQNVFSTNHTALSLDRRFTMLRQEAATSSSNSSMRSQENGSVSVLGRIGRRPDPMGPGLRGFRSTPSQSSRNRQLALQMAARPAVLAALKRARTPTRNTRAGRVMSFRQSQNRFGFSPPVRGNFRGRGGRGVRRGGQGAGRLSRSHSLTSISEIGFGGIGGLRRSGSMQSLGGQSATGSLRAFSFRRRKRGGGESGARVTRAGRIGRPFSIDGGLARSGSLVGLNRRGAGVTNRQQRGRARSRSLNRTGFLRRNINNQGRRQNGVPSQRRGRGGGGRIGRGGRGGRVGRGGRGGTNKVPTREDLDKELDQYMSGTRTALDRDIDTYMNQPAEGQDSWAEG